jgi:hypothetical protein
MINEAELRDIFKKFYSTILSNEFLSIFFSSNEQIENLIEMQKNFFIAAMSMDNNTFMVRYMELGKKHYKLGIPLFNIISAVSNQMIEKTNIS